MNMRYQKQFVQHKARLVDAKHRLNLTHTMSSIGDHNMIKKDGIERVFKGKRS